jgi:hypothetical protein
VNGDPKSDIAGRGSIGIHPLSLEFRNLVVKLFSEVPGGVVALPSAVSSSSSIERCATAASKKTEFPPS